MIIPHPEWWLIGGLAGLYLYDSALLLSSHQAVLFPGRRGRWHARFGEDNFQLRGKGPFVPNPLLPHRPLYRCSWRSEGSTEEGRTWAPPGQDYRLLAPFVGVMFLAVFVLIPLGLLTRLGDIAMAAGIVLFYLAAVMALSLVWFNRSDYGLGRRQFVALAVECLTCPPFAVNLVRHLSLALPENDEFLAVVDYGLTGAERDVAFSRVIACLKNEIDWEDEGSLRAQTLMAQLNHLSRRREACR